MVSVWGHFDSAINVMSLGGLKESAVSKSKLANICNAILFSDSFIYLHSIESFIRIADGLQKFCIDMRGFALKCGKGLDLPAHFNFIHSSFPLQFFSASKCNFYDIVFCHLYRPLSCPWPFIDTLKTNKLQSQSQASPI